MERNSPVATAIEVLNYIRANHATMGKMQRQKLLYYAQAWHLTWNGTPLFTDKVEAWEMGPVVRDAWKVDPTGDTWPAPRAGQDTSIPDDAKATVEAVIAFYGTMNGTQLSELTHAEFPWKNAYETSSVFNRGQKEIKPATMRGFYTLEALHGRARPQKPALVHASLSAAEVNDIAGRELPRWQGVLDLLADR
jgi:uncharacterized phage-associated protein